MRQKLQSACYEYLYHCHETHVPWLICQLKEEVLVEHRHPSWASPNPPTCCQPHAARTNPAEPPHWVQPPLADPRWPRGESSISLCWLVAKGFHSYLLHSSSQLVQFIFFLIRWPYPSLWCPWPNIHQWLQNVHLPDLSSELLLPTWHVHLAVLEALQTQSHPCRAGVVSCVVPPSLTCIPQSITCPS